RFRTASLMGCRAQVRYPTRVVGEVISTKKPEFNGRCTDLSYNDTLFPEGELRVRGVRQSSKESAMTPRKGDDHPPEPRRKEIFQALVDAQDQEMSVAQSRKFIAERFGVS